MNPRTALARAAGLLAGLFLAWIVFSKLFELLHIRRDDDGQRPAGPPAKVRVTVFYEVLCPDSRHFVLHQLMPAWEKLSDIMEVELKPFGKAQYTKGPREYSFRCQHGPTECLGNRVHACAVHHLLSDDGGGDPNKLMHYVQCMIADNYEPLDAAARCAKELNFDWSPVQRCVSGRQGEELLVAAGDSTLALRPKASFIPTVLLNDSQEDQKAILKNLLREVCRKYQGPSPPNCVESL